MSDYNDLTYTEICSAQTIFSDNKGFFGDMFDGVMGSVRPYWIQNVFEKAKNDSEKLKLLFDDVDVSGALLGTLEHVKPVYREKDAIFSYQRRLAGDKLIQQNDYTNAVIVLTQAILRAPTKGIDLRYDGGLSLALAFWSRSLALLELNRGDDALVDIQCAIENGLNDIKKTSQYFIRLAKAYALCGDKCKLEICLNLAKRLSKNPEEFHKQKTEVEQTEAADVKKQKKTLELSGGENKYIKDASNKVEIHASIECGNYAVAKENIQAGDVLVIEQPLAACLLPKYFSTHCHHCLKRIQIAYGCTGCAGIAFCSPQCQQDACNTYHRFECKFTDLLIGSGMSILCFIALRMITQYDNIDLAIRENKLILEKMCTHSHQRKANDYMQRCVMSAFLLCVLQKSGYFERRTTESAYPNSENEWNIIEILVGLLQVLQFNAHEIFDSFTITESNNSTNETSEKKKFMNIGVSIYQSAAYFNHSCYPAVIRFFVGKKIVLTASRPLKSGEIVAENYGPIFLRQTLSERRRNLKSRYWFLCDCISCKENWPTLDNLNDKARLRCPTNGCKKLYKYPLGNEKILKCIGCNQNVDLQVQIDTLTEVETLYRNGSELIDDGNCQEAGDVLFDGINLFYTVAIPPHRSTHIAQEALRKCLVETYNV